jgi:hypothetical protein
MLPGPDVSSMLVQYTVLQDDVTLRQPTARPSVLQFQSLRRP